MKVDLYWLDPTLAIAARPRGNDWLNDEMAALRAQGIDTLVSCLTPSEEQDLGLTEERGSATGHGLGFVRTPMEDRDVPHDADAFDSAIEHLAQEREAGRVVAVHCRQGLGRSPLVAGALLVRDGMSAEDAWTLIRQKRGAPGVPQTEAQEKWLEAAARRRTARAYFAGEE